MSWFRRRKLPEYEIVSHDVPLSTIVRWFIHDIGYGEDHIDDLIGLNPISDEGITKEAEDSELRLKNLSPLVPFIDSISDVAANTLVTIAAKTADEHGEPLEADEEALEMLSNLYKSIALSSIIGALSTAVALGLIDITTVSSEMYDLGGIYDE